MAANTRTKGQIEHDRVKVAWMLAEGMTQREIADKLGVALRTAQLDIAAVEAQWRAETVLPLDRHRARNLAQSRRLYRHCLQQFGFKPSARWVEMALKALDHEAKLLGLFAPAEVTVNVRKLVEAEAKKLGIPAAELLAEVEAVAAAAWDAAG